MSHKINCSTTFSFEIKLLRPLIKSSLVHLSSDTVMIRRRCCHIYDRAAWLSHIKTLSDHFSRHMRVYKTRYASREGSINTTSTYHAAVRLTSIANRSIRRDPRTGGVRGDWGGGRGRCGQSRETPSKQLSQPRCCSLAIHHCFIKIEALMTVYGYQEPRCPPIDG